MKHQKHALLVALTLGCASLLHARPCQALAAGGHIGMNLENGDFHLGGDLLVRVAQITPIVSVSVWPSFAHVFRFHKADQQRDVELFGVDFPFRFELSKVLSLFVGPGFGLAVYEDVTPKFNIIQGMFLQTGPVRPFAEVALRFINGNFVDLLVGCLVEF